MLGDLDKQRLTIGYVFTLIEAPVSWKSTLQSAIALSTIEVEYMTLTKEVKEAIWLGGLLDELRVGQKQISIHHDSKGRRILMLIIILCERLLVKDESYFIRLGLSRTSQI